MFDVIYLQIENDGSNEFDDQATWCQDKINDTDVKYILADNKTEAADDLYEALKHLVEYIDKEGPAAKEWKAITEWCEKGEQAILKAEGKS